MNNNQNNSNQQRGNNNNQGRPNNNRPQQQIKKPTAEDMIQTVANNLEMISVGWNITDSQIEKFVSDIMDKTGIPLSAVRLKTYNKGDQTQVSCYAIFPQGSPQITEGSGKDNTILPWFSQHMQGSGVKLTKSFSDVIRPLTHDKDPNKPITAQPRDGYLVIELDIFEVVGMMLYYNKSTHRINIAKVGNVGQDIILTAYKTVITKGKPHRGSRDKFANMI